MSVFMKRDRFSHFPLPYRKLKYIESTGTQYINTGFNPNQDTRVVLDADVPDSTAAVYVLGVTEWGNGSNYQIRISSSGTTFTSDYGTQAKNTGVTPIGRMVFDKNKNICSIGGISVTQTAGTFQCTTSLKLLAGVNTSGSHRTTPKGKIYACQVYDNGVLIRDYIPVKMKESEEIGLWDKVNGVFYGNAGSGTFIAGEVVA